MVCEKCNKKKVTIFYSENINGAVRSLRLCGDCAAAMQESGELEQLGSPIPSFVSPFSALDDGFFSELSIGTPLAVLGISPAQGRGLKKCPRCGASLGEILDTGRIGCDGCYDVFSDELTPAIRLTHGQTTHTGRMSRSYRARKEKQSRIAELRKSLREAVSSEDFETAATLRDRIRAIEAEG